MKSRLPSWRERRVKRDSVSWEGWLQPTDFSACYKLRIELADGGLPKTYLLSHPIENAEGERAPHLYRDDRLCLYHPNYNEWHRGLFIHETIVPWSSLWLYYYEIWLTTGEWLGGGEHPELDED
jgi:hypothetical protein